MSGARAPAGIDTLDKDDEALLAQMRADGDGDPSQDIAPAPAPDAAPPAAPDAPAAGDHEPADDRGGQVPSYRLREETAARKAAEAAAAEARAEVERARARFEERLKVLGEVAESAVKSQQAPPAKPAEIAVPDYDTDPIGHLRAKQQILERQLTDKDAIITGLSQNQQAADQAAELRNWASQQEIAFAQKNPDWPQATAFLRASRHAELEAIGYKDAAVRERQVITDLTGIAMAAKQQNADFAEWIYKAAGARGYKKADALPPPLVAPVDTVPASTLPPLMPTAPARAAPAANVQRREAARDNATSLSNVSGSAAPRAMTPAQIADMSDVQFDAYVSQLNGAQKRELFGD